MQAIEIHKLSKRFPEVNALSNITFEAEEGEFLVIIGPNGAGKSTLLKVIAGLYKPTSGTVKVLGSEIDRISGDLKKRISFLGENYSLYDNLTSYQNMKFFSMLYDVKDFEAKALDLANKFEASEYMGRKVSQLSRGTKQKIALCRALINEPKMLVLDEPSAFLDPRITEILHRNLSELADNGCTILYATQRLEELYRISRKVLLLNRGKAVKFGELKDVISRLTKISVEITTINYLQDSVLEKLFRYNVRRLSANTISANVKRLSEVPKVIASISKLGGDVINVNSVKNNISEIIKRVG